MNEKFNKEIFLKHTHTDKPLVRLTREREGSKTLN
jgi:hypothetical protein